MKKLKPLFRQIRLANKDALHTLEMLGTVPVKNVPDTVSAWRLQENMDKLEAAVKSAAETRGNLIQEYGEKDKDGKFVTDDRGQFIWTDPKEFTRKYNELMAEEVQVQYRTIRLSGLDGAGFPVDVLKAMKWMIEDDLDDEAYEEEEVEEAAPEPAKPTPRPQVGGSNGSRSARRRA